MDPAQISRTAVYTLKNKAEYDCVGNPYNESPKHWIGLDPHSSPDDLTRDLIRNSYEIVKAKYTKKKTV